MDDQSTNDVSLDTIENKLSNDELDNLTLNAIAAIRKNKKRPDISSVYDYLNKTLSNSYITKEILSTRFLYLIENHRLKNKPVKEKDSYYIVDEAENENDRLNTHSDIEYDNFENQNDISKNLESESLCIAPTPMIHNLKTPNNNITGENELSTKPKYVSKEMFDTLYDDYIEYKHYINDILNTISTSNIHKKDINKLENEIEYLKTENKILKENNKSQLKIIELLSLENEKSTKRQDTQNDNIIWKTQSRHKRNRTVTDKNSFIVNTDNPFDILEHKEPSPVVDWYEDSTSSATLRRTNNVVKRRPNVCLTEDYIKNYELPIRTVPGTKESYAHALEDSSKNILIIGDSHVRHINRYKLQNSFPQSKTYVKSFSGATTQDLHHYILPSLKKDDKPDIITIHIGSNNIRHNNIEEFDAQQLANSIINIGKICKNHGVMEVVISSIFVKNNIKLSKVIGKVNEFLSSLCKENGFHYVSHQNIVRKHLSRDGIHLSQEGTNLFAGNLVDYIEYFILDVVNDLDSNLD